MIGYQAPLRDIQFVLHELLAYGSHCQSLPGAEAITPDTVNTILDEAARFCEKVLAPINQSGDREGCTLQSGKVTTPTGFKEAFKQFVNNGWPAMTHSPEYGGQGLPYSLGTVFGELTGAANWAWSMYAYLIQGAVHTLEAHGTAEQKATYLKKLVTGSWASTMCLTEAHCGSDLGLLRTKAEPDTEGSYRITGTKIFISGGEHDLTDNIIHIVLARLPDAPAGTRGISLFIVPKYHVNPDDALGERNSVSCGAIEDKMGIHGNATCVMNFDGAKGYLLGPPNKGLNCMFTFMNTERLVGAIQGLAHAEVGYQKSLAYTRERLQMRSLSGIKNPDSAADPIIVHPDVRRMLLTQKAFAEGSRILIYYAALLVDKSRHATEETERQSAEELLGLLTPLAKAFVTEIGFEAANLGLQCFGGHGYIREWGMEQNVRDARIATLYEGTTGIQALDLLNRKILKSDGKALKSFTHQIEYFCQARADDDSLQEFLEPLSHLVREWHELTDFVALSAEKNADEIGAAAVDYLMYAGYVTLAYFWARAAANAQHSLSMGTTEETFYKGKVHTARFYYQRILPRTRGLVESVKAGAPSIMAPVWNC